MTSTLLRPVLTEGRYISNSKGREEKERKEEKRQAQSSDERFPAGRGRMQAQSRAAVLRRCYYYYYSTTRYCCYSSVHYHYSAVQYPYRTTPFLLLHYSYCTKVLHHSARIKFVISD